MARLLADENFPLPVVEELRRLGHDVLTLADAGKADQSLSDTVVLAWARGEQRSVLTLNRWDFIRIHDSGALHSGIIACTFDLEFSAQAARIHVELLAHPDMSGRLVRVNLPQR